MKAWAKASAAAMKHLCPKKPTAIKRDDYKSPEDQVRVKKQCRMRTAVIWHILCDHRRAASHNLVDCRKQPVNLQRTMLGKDCQPHCGDIRGIRIAMGRRDFHHDVALVEFPSQMFEIDGPAQRDDGGPDYHRQQNQAFSIRPEDAAHCVEDSRASAAAPSIVSAR